MSVLVVGGVLMRRVAGVRGLRLRQFNCDGAFDVFVMAESWLAPLLRSSFPRRRVLLYFGVAEHPETSAPSFQTVIPANAGIQRLQTFSQERPWMFGYAEVKQNPRSRE
ncbi:hypothetical protein ACFQ4Q_02075 [Lysobacter gummosus]|uniref:hypothetical protein n=1 Tax=Lysobacter gummosus TaxID=262324 RepID=UPI00362D6F9A